MNRPVLKQETSRSAMTAEWKPLADFSPRDIADWRDLAARALEPNVFLEPDFALAALKLPGEAPGAALVREGGCLTGFFPGAVEGIGMGRAAPTFVGWTHPFAPLGTPLVDRDCAHAAVEAFFAFLPFAPGGPKLALFPLLHEGGAFARSMSEVFQSKGWMMKRFGAHERAAFSPADKIALSAKKLKELRRQRRRLEDEGMLTHEIVSTDGDIEAVMSAYLALEAKGWKGRGGSAAQSDAVTESFMRAALQALGEDKKTRFDFLRLNSQPIAAAITLFSGDRAWFWKISYDEDYARFSPGVQLSLDLTESLSKETKPALVDSCAVAGHPMIDHLWARRIQLADWLVPLSGSASFAAGILFEQARRFSISTLKAARELVR